MTPACGTNGPYSRWCRSLTKAKHRLLPTGGRGAAIVRTSRLLYFPFPGRLALLSPSKREGPTLRKNDGNAENINDRFLTDVQARIAGVVCETSKPVQPLTSTVMYVPATTRLVWAPLSLTRAGLQSVKGGAKEKQKRRSPFLTSRHAVAFADDQWKSHAVTSGELTISTSNSRGF